ncbi:GNAT family N-acetyltransferase [Paenibacillus sp. CAU 1782]
MAAIMDRPGNPEGIEIGEFGGTLCLYSRTMPWGQFNAVKGLKGSDIGYLDDILLFYKERDRKPQLEIVPSGFDQTLHKALAQRGFYSSGVHTSMYVDLADSRRPEDKSYCAKTVETKMDSRLAEKVDTKRVDGKLDNRLAEKVDTKRVDGKLDNRLAEKVDTKRVDGKLDNRLAEKVDTKRADGKLDNRLAEKVDTKRADEKLDNRLAEGKMDTELVGEKLDSGLVDEKPNTNPLEKNLDTTLRVEKPVANLAEEYSGFHVDISELEENQLELYATIHCRGTGLSDDGIPYVLTNNSVLYNRPGWSFYLASVDGQPAAVGVMHRHGDIASFTFAATLPEYRKLGLHGLLLEQRLRAAQEQGCKLAVGQCAFLSQSHRNMERAGMKIGYVRSTWTEQ